MDEYRPGYMAEIYNLRVIYEWQRNVNPSFPYIDGACSPQERDAMIARLENVPLPAEVTSCLMWEPYLT